MTSQKEETFQFKIPVQAGPMTVDVKSGTSAIFVGANGGGKKRLAVLIERDMGDKAHRISAHRALTLNPSVPKITERQALAGLRTGYADESASATGHRSGHRWQSKEAVLLLNDFDFLVQALFADQANKSLETHKKNRAGDTTRAEPTKFERLAEIWRRLLPHRHLHISGDDIDVSITQSGARYKASEMSDGERAIFYMIGQTLTAAEKILLLVDEPELHVHRSIMARLWDELEAARPDCAFVYITPLSGTWIGGPCRSRTYDQEIERLALSRSVLSIVTVMADSDFVPAFRFDRASSKPRAAAWATALRYG